MTTLFPPGADWQRETYYLITTVFAPLIFVLTAFGLLGTPAAYSQDPRSTVEYPTSCEAAGLYRDDAVIGVQEAKGTCLILIARLGDHENSSRLNRERLAVLKKTFSGYPDCQLVTAEGERVSGMGRVEMYVQGKLLHTLIFKRNRRTIDCSGI